MKALILILRGLHAGYVGCYGNEWLATPCLDRLAAEGVVFDQHSADVPDAAGARRSWRSGCHQFPLPDGKHEPPTHDLLALLRQQGVTTSLVLDGSRSTPAGFADGWDHVHVTADDAEGTPLERTLEAAVDAIEKLEKHERWLVWVELATLLPPWDLPDTFRFKYFQEDLAGDDEDEEVEDDEDEEQEEPGELLQPLVDPEPGPLAEPADETGLRLQHTYAGAVAYVDAGLELLIEELRRRGLLDQMLVAATSDHGLPLGEHGIFGMQHPWLHDELVHVPLLVRLPGAARASLRVTALTQAIDLLPTLLDAFGLAAPTVDGRSLLPLIRGETVQVRASACSGLRVGDGLEWAIRTPEWAYLLPVNVATGDAPRGPQLYVKPDDRWEVNDLRQQNLEHADELERILRETVNPAKPKAALEETP